MSGSIRLCAVGDSFVAGAGDPLAQGWIGRLVAEARGRGVDVTLYNLGIRRDTSADVAARWQTETARRLPAEHPARLVFAFGVNDCVVQDGVRRLPETATLKNAALILRHAAARAPTLMVGPPPIADGETNERIAALDVALATLCAKIGQAYVPVFDALAADATWMAEVAAGDGAHPGAPGYDALAAIVSAGRAWTRFLAAAPALLPPLPQP
jgi:lysophospholipase L1-like esterase